MKHPAIAPSLTSIDCPIIVLVGPTAVGKTALSLQLVQRFDCEIISMDSMQVYRHMDIGTAKPSQEEQALVPHHLIDIIVPDDQYNAARFVHDALAAIEEIASRNRTVLLTGGTGLYLKALFEGLCAGLPTDEAIRVELRERLEQEGREVLHAELCRIDPVAGARVHSNDTQRLLRGLEIYLSSGRTWTELIAEQQEQKKNQRARFTRVFQVALDCEREQLYQRIAQRSQIMLEQGLIAEVERLRSMGYAPELPSMRSIGYKHVNNLLSGEWTQEEMLEYLIRDTRRYAKRQMTWFRKNQDLNWFARDDYERIVEQAAAALEL
ncbi:MAG: tRNA (adenosine(37)-N6)-dimethylallyltransferase MiaA [Candidatus Electrothrix aestuarii]|uniref:tRNA dimethylallyltransferase n=1 Tax=Candidatus Electrothrix aestuarii TaxID=3062594 RepID=A0AAU8LV71_9BACT|nr:tRNA (adenosine(37)-N6)-dimethylallyltransferase MiaA [Candidatus Electrothrix aestuarii]